MLQSQVSEALFYAKKETRAQELLQCYMRALLYRDYNIPATSAATVGGKDLDVVLTHPD